MGLTGPTGPVVSGIPPASSPADPPPGRVARQYRTVSTVIATATASNIATMAAILRPLVQNAEPLALGSLYPGGTTGAAIVVVVDEVVLDVLEVELVVVERWVVAGARWVVVGASVVVGAAVVEVGAIVVELDDEDEDDDDEDEDEDEVWAPTPSTPNTIPMTSTTTAAPRAIKEARREADERTTGQP